MISAIVRVVLTLAIFAPVGFVLSWAVWVIFEFALAVFDGEV